MRQDNNLKLFEEILSDLNNHNALKNFILIGSWALRVYKEYFDNSPEIPVVVTRDIDLLVPNPPKDTDEIDVPGILEKHGLDAKHNPCGTNMKFIGKDIEVEFLYVEKGAGESSGVKRIDELKIVATPLRYMNFIQTYNTTMNYKGIPLQVPEPEVFVLMKYLLVNERTGKYAEKIDKDIKTAKDLEFFLIDQEREEKFREYYQAMPKKWQKKLMNVLKDHDSELVPILD